MSSKITLSERAKFPVFLFTLVSFAVAGIILTVKIILAYVNGVTEHTVYTNYILSLLQCALGIFALFIPRILQKKYRFTFSAPLNITYCIFLYCAIFLGEVRNYYITVPIWDDILHGFSGVMGGIFAFTVIAVSIYSKNSEPPVISPLLISLFAFVFSISIGALWEIYEFTMDRFLELNMQKYRLNDGTPLIGRDALFDTMKDMVIDTFGALIASFWGYLSLKNNSMWLSKYSKNRKVPKTNE